ncbi:MAG: M23 family metallopeptidase [Bacteriovoracaceae bacterium]|nr:M23 family metallopeptidase [Bacteriovoracaceae bacterium]
MFKKAINLLAVLLISVSCANLSSKTKSPIKIEVKEIQIQPGMVQFLSFPLPDDLASSELYCKNKKLTYFQKDNQGISYLPEDYFSDQKPFDCYLQVGKYKEQIYKVKVADYKYQEEVLKVDPKKVELSKEDQERVNRENIMLNKVYAESSYRPLFDGPFTTPLKTKVTSEFGTKRTYNKKMKGQHLGIDFRAPVGLPIPNSNRGKVVFAADLFYTGNTIIIDHGMTIFTVYAHLDSIAVKEGQIVDKGDILGKGGMTGRVSGPHLHWGVKIQGERVSGFSLIEASKKHFATK